jgi:DNA-binding phage protein
MYTNKNFGFDDSLLNAVRGVVAKNRYMTKAQVETNIEKGFWEAETELVEGKVAYIYENATRTRNKIVIISEKKELDPVNKKALKKDFDDRKDKDIDNDGDSDDSDEYLHKRRKAISKAMKDEASCGTKRMKEDEDLEEETVYVKRRYNNLGANQYSNDVVFAKKISNAASKLGLTAKMNDKNFVISGDPEKIATLKKTVKGVTFSMKEDEDLEEGKKWKSMVQWEKAAKKLGYTVKKQGGYGPIWVAFDHKNNRVAGKIIWKIHQQQHFRKKL